MIKKIVLFSLIGLSINCIDAFSNDKIYEVKRLEIDNKQYKSTNEYIPKEVLDDYEGMESIVKLRKKTKEKYEVVKALGNNKYEFINSFNEYDKAVNEIKKLNDESIVLINETGKIMYAVNGIGRVVNLYNDKPEYSSRDIIKIYPTATSKNHITYINSGYIDDVPIIEYSEKRVKIQVNGVKGWIDIINSETVNAGETTNIVVVPMIEAKNLSYYKKNSSGDLIHYISTDVTKESKGHSVIIGKAPEFMNEGKQYYSYDCNYFYNNINDLINDVKNNKFDSSINKNNKYYNYFSYVSMRSKSNYTGEELNKYFANKTESRSVLRGTGIDFIEAQNKYGINAGLMIGIAMNESGKGLSSIAINKNNIFGLNAVDSNPGGNADKFETVKDCVVNFANGWMSKRYVNPKNWVYNGSNLGNKDLGINVQYASDPFWGEKASSYYYDIDKYLGFKDINNYKIGIYKTEGKVLDKNGNTIYNILKSKNNSARVGYSTNILEKNNGKYSIYSDIQNINSDEYDWNNHGIVEESVLDIINDGGWYIKDGYYHYRDHRGNDLVGWNNIENKWYYFDHSGKMQVGWNYINGKWYYLYSSGEMAKGWLNLNGEYYYLLDDGSMVTSWALINGKWYYFDYSGVMKTGWLLLDSEYYYFNKNGDMQIGWLSYKDDWYYLNSDGKMQKNWIFDGQEWYYANSDGKIQYGWLYDENKWFYLNDSGIMVKGWNYIENEWYYFNNSGEMETGWKYINNKWYYLYDNGVMAKNTIIDGWKIDSNGVAIKS